MLSPASEKGSTKKHRHLNTRIVHVLSSLNSVLKSSSLTSVSNLSKSKFASLGLHNNGHGDLLYNKENCNKLNEMIYHLLTFLAAKCSIPREI